MKVWTILAAMISTSVLADQPADTVPNTAVPPVTAPQPKPVRTSISELRTVPLIPGPAVVVANRVNVRGRAGLIGEVIGKLTNGEPVTVIEEVILKNSKPDEPSAWAKINLPDSINVWVHGAFVDRETMTVKATRLNLRGGPGENYSVLGTLLKGEPITEMQTKGHWIQINAPQTAYAFVAAQYLKQEAPMVADVTVPPAQPEPAIVDPAPALEPEFEESAMVAETPQIADPIAIETGTSEGELEIGSIEPEEIPQLENEAPAQEEPLPPRIVSREGLVRSTLSIQAPTKFALFSPDNFRAINYLHTTSTNLDLSRYKGLRIIVTGEEGLDERWKNTPVITIQQIRVIE